MIRIIVLKSSDVGMHWKEARIYDPQGSTDWVLILDHRCIGTDIKLFYVVLSCVVFFFVVCLILGAGGRGQDHRGSLAAIDPI